MNDIANRFDQIGEVQSIEEDMIEGEYKDHSFTVTSDGKISVGKSLTGAKPTAKITILTKGMGLDKAEIQVIASTEEGKIASIDPINNGAVLKTENSVSDKIYEVTSNGIYKFRITGTNGRTAVCKKSVNSILIEMEAESILEGLSRVNTSGLVSMKVKGKTPDKPEGEEISYRLNVINREGNVVLNAEENDEQIEELKTEGITVDKTNKTYSFGIDEDIGKESTDAQNAVVLRVNGDLTINEGVTATALGSTYGGPKGLIIYCTGTLTNNGTVNMTARGAKAAGENVYLLKNKNTEESFEYIPAVGAGPGGGLYVNNTGLSYGYGGSNGTNRQTGGGAGGAACDPNRMNVSAFSAGGSAGTSYSGGTGGGGAETTGAYDGDKYAGGGNANGGAGGYGGGYGGPGAGNPSGGTGGLLIIYAKNIQNNKDILSNGSQSPGANARGGASGGGSINIFYLVNYKNDGTVNADGPDSASGGKGGNGTVTSGKIENGIFKIDT